MLCVSKQFLADLLRLCNLVKSSVFSLEDMWWLLTSRQCYITYFCYDWFSFSLSLWFFFFWSLFSLYLSSLVLVPLMSKTRHEIPASADHFSPCVFSFQWVLLQPRQPGERLFLAEEDGSGGFPAHRTHRQFSQSSGSHYRRQHHSGCKRVSLTGWMMSVSEDI